MEDKTFELLEKMYSDLTGRMDSMEKNMATKEDIGEVKQHIVRLENKMDDNHKLLHDGYKQTYEKLTTLEEKVDEMDKKIERQDVEIRVIKAAK